MLLERLIAKGVPIDGFAAQGHIKPFVAPFNQEIYSKFLAQISSLGLRMVLSEFDVADKGGDPDPAKRDVQIASATKTFLDVFLANSKTTGMLTWGLSDRGSWLSTSPSYEWPDGQLVRGLHTTRTCTKADLVRYSIESIECT